MRTVNLPPNVGDNAYWKGNFGRIVSRAKGSGKLVFVPGGEGDAFVVSPGELQSAMKVSGGAELVALRELGAVCRRFKLLVAHTGLIFGALPGDRGEILAYVRREADVALLPRTFEGRAVRGVSPKKKEEEASADA